MPKSAGIAPNPALRHSLADGSSQLYSIFSTCRHGSRRRKAEFVHAFVQKLQLRPGRVDAHLQRRLPVAEYFGLAVVVIVTRLHPAEVIANRVMGLCGPIDDGANTDEREELHFRCLAETASRRLESLAAPPETTDLP